MPPDVIKAKIAPYRRRGKPWHRNRLQNLDDYDIVRIYGAEYRGIVNYYLLAQDVWRLSVLCWYAQTSMLKTLACQAQVLRGQDGRPLQGESYHRPRPQDLLRSQTAPRGQERTW